MRDDEIPRMKAKLDEIPGIKAKLEKDILDKEVEPLKVTVFAKVRHGNENFLNGMSSIRHSGFGSANALPRLAWLDIPFRGEKNSQVNALSAATQQPRCLYNKVGFRWGGGS
jgi:hypothetical protein